MHAEETNENFTNDNKKENHKTQQKNNIHKDQKVEKPAPAIKKKNNYQLHHESNLFFQKEIPKKGPQTSIKETKTVFNQNGSKFLKLKPKLKLVVKNPGSRGAERCVTKQMQTEATQKTTRTILKNIELTRNGHGKSYSLKLKKSNPGKLTLTPRNDYRKDNNRLKSNSIHLIIPKNLEMESKKSYFYNKEHNELDHYFITKSQTQNRKWRLLPDNSYNNKYALTECDEFSQTDSEIIVDKFKTQNIVALGGILTLEKTNSQSQRNLPNVHLEVNSNANSYKCEKINSEQILNKYSKTIVSGNAKTKSSTTNFLPKIGEDKKINFKVFEKKSYKSDKSVTNKIKIIDFRFNPAC